MVAILYFWFLSKAAKHKIASMPLTIRDGAILSKFSTPGYLSNILCSLLENFLKTAAILNWVLHKCSRKYFGEEKNSQLCSFIAML